MRSRAWLVFGMLAFPALAVAQTVKEADLLGGWAFEVEKGLYPSERDAQSLLLLWPDGLWWYNGPLHAHVHGGGRWRLVGDKLWLGYDYYAYATIGSTRVTILGLKGHKNFASPEILDTALIKKRVPYPVPDAVYWSKSYRDTTTHCSNRRPSVGLPGGCGTWVYQVSAKGNQQFSLVLLDRLSRNVYGVTPKVVLNRNAAVGYQDGDIEAGVGTKPEFQNYREYYLAP